MASMTSSLQPYTSIETRFLWTEDKQPAASHMVSKDTDADGTEDKQPAAALGSGVTTMNNQASSSN